MAAWRSGNAGVCKTSMRRSDSGRGLQKEPFKMVLFVTGEILAKCEQLGRAVGKQDFLGPLL